MKNLFLKGFILCALLIGGSVQADAQLTNILNKVVSAVTGSNKVTTNNLEGTWTFSGSAIEMESSNSNSVIGSLTGTATSSVVEKKIDNYLSKAGIATGKFTIQFNSDNTFVITNSKGTQRNGTYSISDGNVVLTMNNSSKGITCQTELESSTLRLMVSADKLLSLASTLSSLSSSNSNLKLINSLLKNYSGMNAGLKFTKSK